MITAIIFMLMGLLVFGPKKTIEMAQELVRVLTRLKQAAGQFKQSAMDSDRRPEPTVSAPNPTQATLH